jgi:hypothetical protein
VSIVGRHVENPRIADWTEVKKIFRFLKYTKDKCLQLGETNASRDYRLLGYVDAD